MRTFIATILLFFAVFGLPDFGGDAAPPQPQPQPAAIVIPEPAKEMKDAVAGIAAIMKDVPMSDRMMWASVWSKAARAVEADSKDTKVVWSTTEKLKQFTETAIRIGWKRLGGNQTGKFEGLSAAVEAAFKTIMTTRAQDVTPELRKKYVDLCYAIAWAGVGRDQ